MQLKYILFYLSLIVIISLTILGMIFISNNYQPKQDYNDIIDLVLKKETLKIDENKEWVYDIEYSDEIIIPSINILDDEIKVINKELLEYDYNKVLNASYLYSINADLLSILYTKTYEEYKEYEIYNINLGSTKLMSGLEALEYINKDINTVNEVVSLTIKRHLENLNLPVELLNSYYNKTMDNYFKSVNEKTLDIYLGSNKEINVLVDIYTDHEEELLINIVDKN